MRFGFCVSMRKGEGKSDIFGDGVKDPEVEAEQLRRKATHPPLFMREFKRWGCCLAESWLQACFPDPAQVREWETLTGRMKVLVPRD